MELKVSKIDTKLQNADYLTKGLPQEVYHANRQRVQGWVVMLDDKPQFVLDKICASETTEDSAERRPALSPTYERESKDIARAGGKQTDKAHMGQLPTSGTDKYPMGSDECPMGSEPMNTTDTESYDQSSQDPSHGVPYRSRNKARPIGGFA